MTMRFPKVFPQGFKPTFYPERLKEPSEHKKPSKIFVCSIADIFASWTPLEWRNAILDAIYGCPVKHTFQLLTKNPENIPKGYVFPENVWVGTTVTNENDDWKNVAEIKKVNAKVRFVSFEPLLGPLPEDVSLKGLEWVIVGKLTGSNKVPINFEWLTSIIDKTADLGIPLFLKNNLGLARKMQQFPS